MPDDKTPAPAIDADDLRLVLFGMPAAGKTSLLGALARAGEVQEHLLGGKLTDPSHGLEDLEQQVYEATMRRTADEVVPYVVHYEPVAADAQPRPVAPVDAVLMDCDGRVANDLLVRRKTLDENSPEGTLAHEVVEADTLILVIDASAPPAQVEADFAEFARFLRSMERGRKLRSDVAGLPVFLVLTKCDLLARPEDSPAAWMDRIEQRKREVDAHFREFLARQKPEAPAKEPKPEAPARETLEGEALEEGRRVESPFGSIDLHIWATAVKRPALAGSPARPRDPYGVAELFRQCLTEASAYRARVRRASRRLWLLVGGTGAALVGMLVLTVTLWLTSQSSRASLLAARIEDQRLESRGGPAERLRGRPSDLRRRLSRFQEIHDDPQFSSLPADLRNFVDERITELKEYIDYLEKLEKVKERPLSAETSEEALEQRLERLRVDLAPPRPEWEGTTAAEERRQEIERTEALRQAIRRARNWYTDAAERAGRLWSFADYRAAEDAAGIDWAAWTASVEKLLDPSYKPPFSEAEALPGAPSLTYGTALRFNRVVEDRQAWDTERTRLGRLLDVTSALGLATANPKRPALLVFPRNFSLAQAKTRAAEFKDAYRDQAKTFTREALPEAIVPKVVQVAGNQYQLLLAPGREEVLRQLRLAGRGTTETTEKWEVVRTWLGKNPEELASWRFLAGVLLRLQKRSPEDPVEALAAFLGKKQFVLEPKTLTLELPDLSGLVPQAEKPLVVLHPASDRQPALAFEPSGEPQHDRARRVRIWTYRLTVGDRVIFRPGDNLWAELRLRGGKERLVWSQARSALYLVERLRNPPRQQPVNAKSLDDGRLIERARLLIRPEDSVPRVPDLLPDVRRE
jgi:hypothetical protein